MGPPCLQSIVVWVCAGAGDGLLYKHNQCTMLGVMKGYTGDSCRPEDEMTFVQVTQRRLPGGSHVCAGFLKDKWEEGTR